MHKVQIIQIKYDLAEFFRYPLTVASQFFCCWSPLFQLRLPWHLTTFLLVSLIGNVLNTSILNLPDNEWAPVVARAALVHRYCLSRGTKVHTMVWTRVLLNLLRAAGAFCSRCAVPTGSTSAVWAPPSDSWPNYATVGDLPPSFRWI